MAGQRLTDATLTQAGASGRTNGNGKGSASWETRGTAAAAILPTGLVVLLLVLATSYDGAFHLRHWGPTALLAVVTLLAMHLAGGALVPRGPVRVAVIAIWAFAGWTLLSATWAQSPALAWEGANRTILYAALVTLALLTLAPAKRLAIVGQAVVAGIVLLAVVTLARMLAHSGPQLFLAGRLDSPVGYRNGTAALFAFPVWPLIVVAAPRGRSPALRAGAVAAAVLCLGLAFSTQSRGVALGLGCGALVALTLGPDRVRRAWLVIAVVSLVALVSSPLLEPYDAFTAGHGPANAAAIKHAANALALVTLGAFALSFLLVLLDNGLRAPQLESGRRLAHVALGVVAAVIVVGALAKVGNPVSYLDRKVHEFKQLNPTAKLGTTRLGSVGGQRYDLWRIAMNEWNDHPLAGVGEGNYQFDYYVQRRTDRNLTDPHSLPLRLLAETGLIGVLLFGAFLAALVAAFARGWRKTPPPVRRTAVALAAGGAVVLGQNAVDWLWLIPGLTGLGLFAAALSASMVSQSAEQALPALPARRSAAWAVVAVGLVLAALSLLPPYLADMYERSARAHEGASAAKVLADARSAERYDPYSVVPHYLQAGALEDLGRRGAAREELLQALDLEPRNAATLGLLGDFEARAGQKTAAVAWYRRALALDPLDVGLQKLATGQFSG